MILITDDISEKNDEGGIKIANGLAKQLKEKSSGTMILSCRKENGLSDRHLKLNQLFINRSLFNLLREKREPVLYIPLASNTKASIFRTFVLSRYCSSVSVLFMLRYPMNKGFTKLLEWSKATILTLSAESAEVFRRNVSNPVVQIKTGVDTKKFSPVNPEKKLELRRKYGIPENRKVIVHVGHMKEGRNIRQLLTLDEEYYVYLVVSSRTKENEDKKLKKELQNAANMKICDTYIENIEEVYQLADIYFFPVVEKGNCIDIPLSVLEAASCGIPVVTTSYGAIGELISKDGFYQIESFRESEINELLHKAYLEGKSGRESVLEYSWESTVNSLLLEMKEKEKEEEI